MLPYQDGWWENWPIYILQALNKLLNRLRWDTDALLRTHCEMFPQNRAVTKKMVKDLRRLLVYGYNGKLYLHYSSFRVSDGLLPGRVDTMSTINSTFPYSSEKTKAFLETLREIEGKCLNCGMVWCESDSAISWGRAWGRSLGHRWDQLHFQYTGSRAMYSSPHGNT
jgi:hypothetical protein